MHRVETDGSVTGEGGSVTLKLLLAVFAAWLLAQPVFLLVGVLIGAWIARKSASVTKETKVSATL